VALLVVAFGLTGLAMGPAYAALSVTTLAVAEPGLEGRSTSALQLTDVLGVALGTGVAGAIVAAGDGLETDLRWSLTAVFGLAVGLAVLGSQIARGVPARLPAEDATPPDFGLSEEPGYLPPP
jgi:MFS family permease